MANDCTEAPVEEQEDGWNGGRATGLGECCCQSASAPREVEGAAEDDGGDVDALSGPGNEERSSCRSSLPPKRWFASRCSRQTRVR